MSVVTGGLREVWGLFVEDASFTIAIVAVVLTAIFVVPRVVTSPSWRGPLVFIGLAAVLLENVFRSARSPGR